MNRKAATVPSPEKIAESTHALWHDPTTYDPFRHGPPYLPNAGRTMTNVTAARTKKADHVDLHTLCSGMCAEYGENAASELSVLLAWLRAGAFIHQTHHWQTRGQNYYGDHLLFDRLYEESTGMIDDIAERAVGSVPHMGHTLVQPLLQAGHMTRIVWMFHPQEAQETQLGPDSYAATSLAFEKHLLDVIPILRGRMEVAGRLSLGTDNLLQGISDKHESFTYLLQQRTKVGSTYTYDRR